MRVNKAYFDWWLLAELTMINFFQITTEWLKELADEGFFSWRDDSKFLQVKFCQVSLNYCYMH